jgi:signal transduction histidine kinase
MIDESVDSISTPALSDLLHGASFTEVLNNYNRLFDLAVRVFDVEGNLLAEASSALPVCHAFCKSEAGKKRCIATRMKIKKAVPEDKRLLSIDCLSGLRYSAAPISFQGRVVGKLVMGPYRPTEQDSLAKPSVIPPDEQIDLAETTRILQSMRATPMTLLRKIANAMLSVLDTILFSAHKTFVTSEMHIAAIRESFKEIAAKNKQLEDMNERMKEFERMKASFLSTVSHELRTPLTSIIGYSDMLVSGIAGSLGEEQQKFIDTIKTKGEELLRMISAILDFTQIETGHLSLDLEEVSPRELLENIVHKSKETADKRGVRLSLQLVDDLPRVMMDTAKIQSAVWHLIDNAVKFSPVGGVVKVSAQITAASGDDASDDGDGFVLLGTPNWLEIAVQDFGEGISGENQSLIFQPFTQLDDSTTREHGGAGLGLALVKQFAAAHNGRVEVKSTPNEGSLFLLQIPAPTD